jgi:hypothetical protein
MEKKNIIIKNNDGTSLEVELITYLFSDDGQNNYVVYSKGEITGAEKDEVIYISKITNDGSKLVIEEIVDDAEWANVQTLLKRIANA